MMGLGKQKIRRSEVRDFCPLIHGRCLKDGCHMWWKFDRHYFDLDESGNKILEDGKPKIRLVHDGRCALASIPQEVMTFRELIQNWFAKDRGEDNASTS